MTRYVWMPAIIALVLLTSAGPVGAQEGPSILTLLEIGDRRLAVGDEISGMLTGLDVHTTSGRRVQAWGLELAASQAVTIDLRSDDFDAYLYVAGPGLSGAIEDDDGAGACHARITFRAPSAGIYRVVVSSVSASTGAYSLTTSASPGPVEPGNCGEMDIGVEISLNDLPTEGRRLQFGAEQSGTLTAQDSTDEGGSYVQAWGLSLTAGQQAAVDLVSDDFDAYLYLVGSGLDAPISNDDGAGGCHARIFFSARETGEYRIIVTTLGVESTGSFMLRVAEQPGPVLNEPCGGPGEDLSALPLEGRRLERDATVRGHLSATDTTSRSGGHVQAWALDARSGETLTVTLRSDEFDAYLRVFGPQLNPVSDDDGAGRCDARVAFTAPVDGVYRVVVGTAFSGVGSFTLEVTDAPAPPSPESCL